MRLGPCERGERPSCQMVQNVRLLLNREPNTEEKHEMISKRLIGLTLGLGLVLAGTAFADGRGPGIRPIPGPRPTPGPVKDRLCVHLCKDDARACVAAAHADARACRADTCGEAIQEARDACAADPASTACADARAAVRECLHPCNEAFRAAMAECGGDLRECIGLCPDAGSTPPKDPACIATCREELHGCLDTVRADAQACREGCSGLVEAAKAACATDTGSTACKDARAAASACLEPCFDTQRTDHAACDRAAGGCAQACPDAPPPTPTVAADAS